MIIVRHRINKSEDLLNTSKEMGVEIDLRTNGKDIILQHDPFKDGELFENWLEHYEHKLLILNIKEEGIEKEIKKIISIRGISNFFFLDQSFPFLIKTTKLGEKRCAVRFSEFEDIHTSLNLGGRAGWVWVDYFSKFPLTSNYFRSLKKLSYKICIVSPELQGDNNSSKIKILKKQLNDNNINIDAVCTKNPKHWA